MIVREKVLKSSSFSRERDAWNWMQEKYPDGIESKVVKETYQDYTAYVYVMEDVEYNHILIPIKAFQEIKTYAAEKGDENVMKLMDGFLNNFKKVK